MRNKEEIVHKKFTYMIAETPGEFPQASALVFPLIIVQADIHSGLQGLSGVSELPLHQLLGSHRGSVLLQPSQNGVGGLGLDSVEHCGTGWLAGFVVCCEGTQDQSAGQEL